MSYQATVFQIFIAGPGDASEFKDLAHRLIHDWNSANAQQRGVVMMPRRWELDSLPTYGLHPQVAINGQLVDDADGMIAIFRDQLGTPTESNISGTVEELDRVNAAGHQVMIYVFQGPVERERATTESFEKLEEFKRELRTKGLYQPFTDQRQLENRLVNHLAQLGNRFAANGVMPNASVDTASQVLGEVRRAVGRNRRLWRSEKQSEPPGISDGKAILFALRDDLASVDSGDNKDLEIILERIYSKIARLQRHQQFLDGGKSYQEFWEGGDEIFETLESVINRMAAHEALSTVAPSRTDYDDVLSSAHLQVILSGPYKYNMERIEIHFLVTNVGQHAADQVRYNAEPTPIAGRFKHSTKPLAPGEQVTVEYGFPRGERINGEDEPRDELHLISISYEDGIGKHTVTWSLEITGKAPELNFELTKNSAAP